MYYTRRQNRRCKHLKFSSVYNWSQSHRAETFYTPYHHNSSIYRDKKDHLAFFVIFLDKANDRIDLKNQTDTSRKDLKNKTNES